MFESHLRHSRNKAREKLFSQSKSDQPLRQELLKPKRKNNSSSMSRRNGAKNEVLKAENNLDLVQLEY